MNEELLHLMLSNINRNITELSSAVRGDGSDSNPGMVVKLDRLIVASQAEKERRQKQEHRLWSAMGILAALLGVVAKLVLP